MTAVAGCADYIDRRALQGFGALLPEDEPPRNGDSLPGTETRTVRGPNPRSFSTRGRAAEGIGGRPHVVGDPRAQCRVPGRGLIGSRFRRYRIMAA